MKELVEGEFEIRITDFGISQTLSDYESRLDSFENIKEFLKSERYGTPFFMCPEKETLTFMNDPFKTDVYSFGVLLYMMVFGKAKKYPGQVQKGR